ncbi:ParA family protein [Kaarinaea lacus]
MKVWAVANQKGGVGKTTTVVSLGGQLCTRGHRTLMVDMDPHGSMTAYFGHDPDNMKHSLYDLFQLEKKITELDTKKPILTTKFDNLYLLPASTAMATLDRQLGVKEGKGLVLNQVLRQLQSRFDNVLIDCPPQLGVLMVNALAACEHLVIPVQTEFLALKGLERMLRTLQMIGQALRKELNFTIVPTMFDCRTRASNATLKTLHQRYAEDMWSAVIPVDTQFREASRLGVPLSIKAPKDRGAVAYGLLLDDLLALEDNDPTASVVAS